MASNRRRRPTWPLAAREKRARGTYGVSWISWVPEGNLARFLFVMPWPQNWFGGDVFIETPDANVEIDEDSDEDETGPGDVDQSSGRQKSFQTFRGRTLLMYSRGNSVLKYLNSFFDDPTIHLVYTEYARFKYYSHPKISSIEAMRCSLRY